MTLFETIKIDKGVIYNPTYHEKRMQESIFALYGLQKSFCLKELIHIPDEKAYRCKLEYSLSSHHISFAPLSSRKVESLKLVPAKLGYDLKYSNRTHLDTLFLQKMQADDVLIVKNGLITDTTIANVACFKEGKWFTPKTPLLKGTTRARLLDEGFLHPLDIKADELTQYSRFGVMNAIVGFKPLKNGIIS